MVYTRSDNKTSKCKGWKGMPKRELEEMKKERKNSGEETDFV
jgi:hypothetical protein